MIAPATRERLPNPYVSQGHLARRKEKLYSFIKAWHVPVVGGKFGWAKVRRPMASKQTRHSYVPLPRIAALYSLVSNAYMPPKASSGPSLHAAW